MHLPTKLHAEVKSTNTQKITFLIDFSKIIFIFEADCTISHRGKVQTIIRTDRTFTAMDKRQDIVKKVRKYQSLIKRSNFPMKIERVYLFGSFAKGNPHKDSDIDVALVVNRWQGDYFEVIPPIWKLAEQVDCRIEPHVIVPEEDYAGLLNEIEQTGIVII